MRHPFLPDGDDYSDLFMFLALLAAVFIGLLFLANAAFAQAPTVHIKESRCRQIETYVGAVDRLPTQLRNQVSVRVLSKDDSTKWVAAFNDIPPKSTLMIERVGLFFRAKNTFVTAVFEKDDCVFNAVRLPLKLHKRILSDSNLKWETA